MTAPLFISEVSSNHARDLDRCLEFVDASAASGVDAVKFQLFRIDELFAPEILSQSKEHSRRKQWELPEEFLPHIKQRCVEKGVQFSCTPFFLEAVEILAPMVDFFKIASYELLWDDLIAACAKTGVPTILSTGMATLDEIGHAVKCFHDAGGEDLTLLHCVSGYPVPAEQCNLSAIDTIRNRFGVRVGWSDHSRSPAVLYRAIHAYQASIIEFHLDLDERGAEYATGHCWLPEEIAPVIANVREGFSADGTGVKVATDAEAPDRDWRADPTDGLRPLRTIREGWRP
ncbi:MAG: N-acetylneuraminate synthase family protein [Alphaproteobacteria bacterium]|nr:N-acetylneuraminate synthase family protein [Alphaproteobacteria bacterium]